MKHREIARLIWGKRRVAKEWHRGCWMDSRIKRRLKKARAIIEGYVPVLTNAAGGSRST